jgi:hypothetical protein
VQPFSTSFNENADHAPCGAGPVFAQPKPTADPIRFSIKQPSDGAAYKTR